MQLQCFYNLVLASTHILLQRNFNKTTMKVKVLFGISAMLLTTQVTMAQIKKDVVKDYTPYQITNIIIYNEVKMLQIYQS